MQPWGPDTRIFLARWESDCGKPVLVVLTNDKKMIRRSLTSLLAQRPDTNADQYCCEATPSIHGYGQVVRVGGMHWTLNQLRDLPDHRGRSVPVSGCECTACETTALSRAFEARERLTGQAMVAPVVVHHTGQSEAQHERVYLGLASQFCPGGGHRPRSLPESYTPDQLREALTKQRPCKVEPRHVEGCACEPCADTRDAMRYQPIVERELSCPVCRRVYGRIRVEACATVEVLCKGCELEGRAKP